MTVTINGTSGITFPAGGTGNTAGAAVGTTDTQTLTNKTLGSGLVAGASLITSGTSQASTSGTSIDFTGIPSWVKRITVMFGGISLSGTSSFLVQVGAGSITTSGYTANADFVSSTVGNTTGAISSTAGFVIAATNAANTCWGQCVINVISGNTWVASHSTGGNQVNSLGGGLVTLSGTLDRVRITTVNGTDTFDAGSINILYE